MKRIQYLIGIAALLCVVFPALAGQDAWHKIALDKTHVAYLVSDPARASTLYAASTRGLLKSLDSGLTWSTSGVGLPEDIHPAAIAINHHNSKELYAGFDGRGIFKSVDSGQSWQAVNEGLPNLFVRCITISPHDPNLIYLGISGGVAISTNGGKFWHMSSGFRRGVNVNALVLDPQNPRYLYAGTGGAGVYKSGNGGVSWKDVNEGLSSLSITSLYYDPEHPDTVLAGAYHPATPTDLYVGEAGGGVYLSADGGRSWQGSSLVNLHIFSFAASRDYPGTIYAGAWGGVYRSTDRGLNWTDINAGLENAFPHTVHVLPGAPPTLLAGTTYGLLSYTDASLPAPAKDKEGAETLLYSLGGGAALILLSGLLYRRQRAKRTEAGQQSVW
jgi:photosystem II stability/assembly factor-like uncharacterized protein